jgi:hypothetical protein
MIDLLVPCALREEHILGDGDGARAPFKTQSYFGVTEQKNLPRVGQVGRCGFIM